MTGFSPASRVLMSATLAGSVVLLIVGFQSRFAGVDVRDVDKHLILMISLHVSVPLRGC